MSDVIGFLSPAIRRGDADSLSKVAARELLTIALRELLKKFEVFWLERTFELVKALGTTVKVEVEFDKNFIKG